MNNKWYISDLHFGHENVCTKFKKEDGSPLRPWSSASEMNEALIENFNKLVGINDTVYNLGDVALNKKYLPLMLRLNGKHILILGNHDLHKNVNLHEYFTEVTHMHKNHGMIFTHIPLHPSCHERFGVNVHGHLHDKHILMPNSKFRDHRYFNVSVECIDFKPIHLDDLTSRISKLR